MSIAGGKFPFSHPSPPPLAGQGLELAGTAYVAVGHFRRMHAAASDVKELSSVWSSSEKQADI